MASYGVKMHSPFINHAPRPAERWWAQCSCGWRADATGAAHATVIAEKHLRQYGSSSDLLNYYRAVLVNDLGEDSCTVVHEQEIEELANDGRQHYANPNEAIEAIREGRNPITQDRELAKGHVFY